MRRRIALLLVLGVTLLPGCFLLQNALPIASFTVTVEQGECPLNVGFDARGSYDSDGTIIGYRWDYGDGWIGYGATCEHTYTIPGTYLARLTIEDDDGDTSQATLNIQVSEVENIERYFSWDSQDQCWTWQIQIPTSLYWYYRNQDVRGWCSDVSCDWYKYVIDPGDDAYIESLSTNLFDAMAAHYVDPDQLYYGFLQFCLDFVTAAIPYTLDSVPDEWPRYPVETLTEREGDCEDTGILFASLVRPVVDTVHLLFFPGHAAAAVPVEWEFIDQCSHEVGYYLHEGQYFVMAETTGDPPSYWKLGELPSSLRADWVGGNIWFYDVGQRQSLTAQSLVHSPQ